MSKWETSIGKSDEYYTPKYVVDALGCEFDQDVAAPKDRTFVCIPAKEFITENSLDLEWKGFVWMDGKIPFIRPDGSVASSPSTGTTLFAYGEKGVTALKNAAKNRLGIFLKKVEAEQ